MLTVESQKDSLVVALRRADMIKFACVPVKESSADPTLALCSKV